MQTNNDLTARRNARATLSGSLLALLLVGATAFAGQPQETCGVSTGDELVTKGRSSCSFIKDGKIFDPTGAVITSGTDRWGYNYQAQKFSGTYCGAYFGASWCRQEEGHSLKMRWNSSFLDNKDCDNDGSLDEHFFLPSYVGSNAWVSLLETRQYEISGQSCVSKTATELVALPRGARCSAENMCYSSDGVELGMLMWDEFYVAEQVRNERCH